MLPSRAGKNRYRVGSGSPCRWRRRTESIAGQQFREAGRTGDKQLHQLSGAFALLVKCATAKHPHVGDSTAGNWAAPGIPPISEQASTCSAVDRKKEPAEHGRNLRIAAGGRQSRADRALARLVYTRGRE
jgi:hypothetical protein